MKNITYDWVVFTNAKILILKLITTATDFQLQGIQVVFTNAKILILKLITTETRLANIENYVVFTNAKILILKLITTQPREVVFYNTLYLPMQRY